jgi:hypothetical protein
MTEEMQKEMIILLFQNAINNHRSGEPVNRAMILNYLAENEFTVRDVGITVNVQSIPKLLYLCSHINTRLNATRLQQMWTVLSQLQAEILTLSKPDLNSRQLAAYRIPVI